jgi:DNA modification methylase
MNKLILGDNLEILKEMDAESVDLIYLDPPLPPLLFSWLKERVEHAYRILKPSGSIFFHCDWRMDGSDIKTILDNVFKENNCRSKIIWKRRNAQNKEIFDIIWRYSKSENFTNNKVYKDEKNPPELRPWRMLYKRDGGYKYEYKGYKPLNGYGWYYSVEDMKKLDNEGNIWFPPDKNKNGYIYMIKPSKKESLGDEWTDIIEEPPKEERIGYPTQKPEKLLERIIKMASNEGDMVLDPFCGSGTTIVVAEKLKRNWVGMDNSVESIKVTDFRLQKQMDSITPLYIVDKVDEIFYTDLGLDHYFVQLPKYDYNKIRYKDPFEFERWIVTKYRGIPNIKQTKDGGIDGKTIDGTPIQVKRSDKIPYDIIDKFSTDTKGYNPNLFKDNIKNKKPVGYFIAFSFRNNAIEKISWLKYKKNIVIELVEVKRFIKNLSQNTAKLNIIASIEKWEDGMLFGDNGKRRVNFTVRHKNSNIAFYSWDFNYKDKFKPCVIMDKEGRQTITLKVGTHNIAVKAVDNNGIENMTIYILEIDGQNCVLKEEGKK